jgi:hypothetical protein
MSVHSVRKYKKLATAKDLNRLTTRYYAKGKIVSKLRPVAWVTSEAPVEILTAMGITSAYPENYNTTVKWRP